MDFLRLCPKQMCLIWKEYFFQARLSWVASSRSGLTLNVPCDIYAIVDTKNESLGKSSWIISNENNCVNIMCPDSELPWGWIGWEI